MRDSETIARWRLVLGQEAEQHQINCQGHGEAQRVEQLVGYLFQGDDSPSSERGGGQGGSNLTVGAWMDELNELFPRSAKEVMEREFVRRRGIHKLLNQPKLLERVEPNVELVKTLLTHQGLLTPKTRILARKIIDKVVQELKKSMKVQVEPAITGALRKDRHSTRKVYRNLDLTTTLRRNLKNYDPKSQKLLVDRAYYYAAERNKRPWHVIVAVDQSGSMLESAIFSAVMASIFYELPAMKTSMFIFDTQVVDLSDRVGQPVDVLMSVQLGGGTDIAQAMAYAHQLVREPARTIVVLVTDFYEGGDEARLVSLTADMSAAGVRTVGLGALGYDARPAYCKSTAKKMRKAGMDVLVCTPEKLAQCMGAIISG